LTSHFATGSPAIKMKIEVNGSQKWVGYTRISTDQTRQQCSLDLQEKAIRDFVETSGGEMLDIIREEESGQSNDRVGLKTAIALAQSKGAKLLVMKLDRIARSVRKIAELLDEVEFLALDYPGASRFHIQLVSCFAEFEAKTISARVKGAMQFLKETQGRKWGSPTIHKTQKLGAEGNRKKAEKFTKEIRPLVQGLKSEGYTLKQIAERLNDLHLKTRFGKSWTEVGVWRLLKVA
jgi:DNA invertase Pin-like site-specific DNA recombinase